MQEKSGPTPAPRAPLARHAAAVSGLLLVALWVFRFLWRAEPGQVISMAMGDLRHEYYPWRVFGSEALRHGHLPLWNPFLYSGSPFFANPETALLYPFNWIHLFLPVSTAINVYVVLHIFLAGAALYLWSVYRGFRPGAGFVAAACFMLSGPVFAHTWPGHLSNLGSMPWAPLIFLAIDGLFTPYRWRFSLLGVSAVALQILAGHIQYLYFTGLIAAVYFGLKLLLMPTATATSAREASRLHRLRAWGRDRVGPLVGFALMYAWAVGIAAVQLFTTAALAATEANRSEALSFKDGTLFSFPPENFLTALVPGFFGQMSGFDYWGRCYFWEMCFFFSVTGFVIALHGLRCADRRSRVIGALVIAICLALALGRHSVFFAWCYGWVPELKHFRGPSKFTFPAAVFFAFFIAAGFDDLLRRPIRRHRLAVACFAIAISLSGLAAWVSWAAPTDRWPDMVGRMLGTHEVMISSLRAHSIALVTGSSAFAVKQTLLSAAILLLVGSLFLMSHLSRWIPRALGAIAILECVLFAGQLETTFDPLSPADRAVAKAARQIPGDFRILWNAQSATPMSLGLKGTWGYSSMTSTRGIGYLLRLLNGIRFPAAEDSFEGKQKVFFDLTRTRMALTESDSGRTELLVSQGTLPRFYFAHDWLPASSPQAALDSVTQDGFDVRRTVVLESPPAILPAGSRPAAYRDPVVTVTREDSDSLDLELDTAANTILVMTDAYANGWTAVPLPGSTQSSYEVMPAYGIIRAIPLRTGHHHFRLAYRPVAFAIGKWVSIFALTLFLAALSVELWLWLEAASAGYRRARLRSIPLLKGVPDATGNY